MAGRAETVKWKIVEFIPETPDDGIVYVSNQYNVAVHRCCCGCGEKVVTPQLPGDWLY